MFAKTKEFLNVSLQVKIMGLVISLILLIVSSITVTFVIMESQEDISKAETLALQTARTLSYMPIIQQTAASKEFDSEISILADRVRSEIGASGILIENNQGTVYTNIPDELRAPLAAGKETYKASVFNSSYVARSGKAEGELILGISPIFVDYGKYGKVEGTVTVALHMDTIKEEIYADTKNILKVSSVVLIAGIIGGVLLTKSIRRDTLGLEPVEIASLYRERNAILQSVKEGILATDAEGRITMMNHSAKEILDIKSKIHGLSLDEVSDSRDVFKLFSLPNENSNVELFYNGKTIIVNTVPVLSGVERVGTVASFRDKTEIKKMVNTLSEVKQYSEDLRAQAHEFKNKLYVLLGLIQLGKHSEAIEFIQEETAFQELNEDIIFSHIQDEKVQAILLGKLAKASETKVQFNISADSSLARLPKHIELQPLLIIISNLIDNAFEAVTKTQGTVSFFATDIGNDIIIEIADTGKGIKAETVSSIFEKGLSEKGENRGFGLFNVKHEIDQLGGSIEFQTSGEGTVFTVFLPKNPEE